ncbi:hypothetical protein BD324DRAFT_606981 [Kockovaella imperatae]|uniref:Zn(2)-C6 fungal-type domain-containing protein n=1 Tax=Kockovaella imperatae TaxID=4999 RepID=A0A1Y1UQJ9_9TREE|nr:hypothetical protein BD324DRAFT_606981 [Kockovaella imperatae]ORX39726.1 hypothetical protein BD324DRAFT_606981 [Kockovaella imperatae]
MPSDRVKGAPAALPCDQCRRSKSRCDKLYPTCSSCSSRDLQCEYSRSRDNRVRSFHHKSKAGCRNCKERRIRCDEAKPVCGSCLKRDERSLCVFSDCQGSTPASTSASQDLVVAGSQVVPSTSASSPSSVAAIWSAFHEASRSASLLMLVPQPDPLIAFFPRRLKGSSFTTLSLTLYKL